MGAQKNFWLILPYSAKAVRRLWAWPVHIINAVVVASGFGHLIMTMFIFWGLVLSFAFHLSDLKIIPFSIYICCLYLHLLVALSLPEAWPPKRRKNWSVSCCIAVNPLWAQLIVFHSPDQVRRYGKGAIISVTKQALISFNRRRRCSKRLLKLVWSLLASRRVR